VLTARERRQLILYLPIGIVTAIVIDLAVFTAIGGPFPLFPEPCAGCPSSTTPIGTALAIGAPIEQSAPGNHWYNFTVQSAGSGILLGNTQIQVGTPGGSIAGATWALVVLDPSGFTSGTYSFANATWSTGANSPIVSGEIITLDSGSDSLMGQGIEMTVLGTGTFDGSISVAIP